MSDSNQELIGVVVGSLFMLAALFWFSRNAIDGKGLAIAGCKACASLLVFAFVVELAGRLTT